MVAVASVFVVADDVPIVGRYLLQCSEIGSAVFQNAELRLRRKLVLEQRGQLGSLQFCVNGWNVLLRGIARLAISFFDVSGRYRFEVRKLVDATVDGESHGGNWIAFPISLLLRCRPLFLVVAQARCR
jgi:hypothetical protein